MLLTLDQESLLGRLHSFLLLPCKQPEPLELTSNSRSNSLGEKPYGRAPISERSPKCTRLLVLNPAISVRDGEITDCLYILVYFPNSAFKQKMLLIQFKSRAKVCAKRES